MIFLANTVGMVLFLSTAWGIWNRDRTNASLAMLSGFGAALIAYLLSKLVIAFGDYAPVAAYHSMQGLNYLSVFGFLVASIGFVISYPPRLNGKVRPAEVPES